MNSASISNELQEANRNLTSKDNKIRIDSMKVVINLFGQGENCSIVQPQIANFQADDNVSMHRFVNILNDAYLKDNPGLIQPVISSILTDFDRPNPQIKALAVRQAGSIADNETAEHLVPIIKAGAQSNDPYIRKAAAMSILKVHHNSSTIIQRFNLGDDLQVLLNDPNPNVASNALCALTEINNTLATPLFDVSVKVINNLLNTIEDATEWCQIQILEFICDFKPATSDDARQIIQRIATRLIQANSGITIVAIRCCLRMCSFIENTEYTKEIFNRIMLSLVSLMNNGNEIQFSALKSIFVILQKFRKLYQDDISIFFCKYDDPLYIKLEKIDIILTLTTDQNIKRVLEELKGYAQQEDVEFVRKSIRAIGRFAIVFESTAKDCVDCLESLIESRIQYIVQECIVVSVNIFRRYPSQYESIISTICQCLVSTLDDHRAKAAMVWILGEYSSMITNAAELIDALFLDGFLEEPTDVQLSILTAIVKFFLSNPDEGQEMLRHVLSLVTNEVDNPDLKDRAYMYLCLLTECPDRAINVVMANDPPKLNIDLQLIEPRLVEALVPLVGSLAIMYKQLPQEFVPTIRRKPVPEPQESQQKPVPEPQRNPNEQPNQQHDGPLNKEQLRIQISPQQQSSPPHGSTPQPSPRMQELTEPYSLERNSESDDGDGNDEYISNVYSSYSLTEEEEEDDEEGSDGKTKTKRSKKSSFPILPIISNSSYETEIRGILHFRYEKRVFFLQLTNNGNSDITILKIMMDRNPFSLCFMNDTFNPITIAANSSEIINFPVILSDCEKTNDKKGETDNSGVNQIRSHEKLFDNSSSDRSHDKVNDRINDTMDERMNDRVADKVSIALRVDRPSPIIFSCNFSLPFLFVTAEEGGKLAMQVFLNHTQNIPENPLLKTVIEKTKIDSIFRAQTELPALRLYFIATKEESGFFSAKTINNVNIVVVIKPFSDRSCCVSVLTDNLVIGKTVLSFLSAYLSL
ncbi:hypothetical protein TRFO_23375 [Tritrichomonas foetus]|uniref:Clathrin/coatomer adaptor adaptin-like N-terminal domain-containing protein n=1 Tax=Tritrichomonas foetus TaxID=1144522 RepID=A0A1J4KB31_9EUKA|nr:hypothetical protein TRFO_23375 [Tritrichomonas foetus]|eukprot:OHT08170.1 hypothetical protein TRFO_23375 [Tritrichomonas foetus]